jgi:hypothetical protein
MFSLDLTVRRAEGLSCLHHAVRQNVKCKQALFLHDKKC